MVIQKVDPVLIALFAILVITNFHKATSLQCYQCKSDAHGTCWSPGSTELIECESQGTTTVPPSTKPSVAPSSSQPSSSTPTNTQTSDNTPSSTPTNTQTSGNTPSSAPPSSQIPSSTPTDTQTSGNTPSLAPSSTQVPSSTPDSGPSFATRSSTPTPLSTTSSTDLVASSSSDETRTFVKNEKNSRRRRSILVRANESGHQCVKIIYKEGETDMVERKCVLKTATPCVQGNAEHENASFCEVCDNENGCNLSSNISFGFISMFIPFSVVFYMMSLA